MIDLYTWGTPNGRKVSVMLEEVGATYKAFPIDINKDDQFKPEFLKISPNNKIPAIVDHDGPGGTFSLFESGAILMYLGERFGRFYPKAARARAETNKWLMFQMGGVGPMLGQAHHFRKFAKVQIPYAIDRYTNEAARLYRVLDQRLGESEYLAGPDYTIADIATYPWIWRHEFQGQRLEDHPNVQRWFQANAARPAVERGFKVP
ncbi:MAG: glutathione S-transferase family protein [Alphaproteobacteria bacterium]|nr:glutathione S-transferase family protein [Alphaproteobacteria bacterium]